MSAETELAHFEDSEEPQDSEGPQDSERSQRCHLRRRLHMKQRDMRLRPAKEPEQSTEREEGGVLEERSINLPDRSLKALCYG